MTPTPKKESFGPLPADPALPEPGSAAATLAALGALSDWLDAELARLESEQQAFCTFNSLRHSLRRGR